MPGERPQKSHYWTHWTGGHMAYSISWLSARCTFRAGSDQPKTVVTHSARDATSARRDAKSRDEIRTRPPTTIIPLLVVNRTSGSNATTQRPVSPLARSLARRVDSQTLGCCPPSIPSGPTRSERRSKGLFMIVPPDV
jgi:hypothetical protein